MSPFLGKGFLCAPSAPLGWRRVAAGCQAWGQPRLACASLELGPRGPAPSCRCVRGGRVTSVSSPRGGSGCSTCCRAMSSGWEGSRPSAPVPSRQADAGARGRRHLFRDWTPGPVLPATALKIHLSQAGTKERRAPAESSGHPCTGVERSQRSGTGLAMDAGLTGSLHTPEVPQLAKATAQPEAPPHHGPNGPCPSCGRSPQRSRPAGGAEASAVAAASRPGPEPRCPAQRRGTRSSRVC